MIGRAVWMNQFGIWVWIDPNGIQSQQKVSTALYQLFEIGWMAGDHASWICFAWKCPVTQQKVVNYDLHISFVPFCSMHPSIIPCFDNFFNEFVAHGSSWFYRTIYGQTEIIKRFRLLISTDDL